MSQANKKDCFYDRDVARGACISALNILVAYIEIESRYRPLSPLLESGLKDAKAHAAKLKDAQAIVDVQVAKDLEDAMKSLRTSFPTEFAVIDGGNDPRSA